MAFRVSLEIRDPQAFSALPARMVLPVLLAGCAAAPSAGPAAPPAFDLPVDLGPPVASDGWEDSGFINPVELVLNGVVKVIGPVRRGWDPADTVAAHLYRAESTAAGWNEPESLGTPLNLPHGLQGDEWVSADGNRILFTDPAGESGRLVPGIYYAAKANGVWQTPVLAALVGFPFVSGDENPHLTRDEQTLFFESSRPGGFGGRRSAPTGRSSTSTTRVAGRGSRGPSGPTPAGAAPSWWFPAFGATPPSRMPATST